MLSRIPSLTSTGISNKRNYQPGKVHYKSLPASLLHCIESILNNLSGKCLDSALTMAAPNFTKSTGLCTIFVHLYLHNNSVTISSVPIPLFVFQFVQAKGFIYLIGFPLVPPPYVIKISEPYLEKIFLIRLVFSPNWGHLLVIMIPRTPPPPPMLLSVIFWVFFIWWKRM